MKTLAVIGTAGRGEDGKKLSKNHWEKMLDATRKVYELEDCDSFISGGAAWADHAAVEIGYGFVPVKIWLPAIQRDIETAKYYHKKFGEVIGKNTWEKINTTHNTPPWKDYKEPKVISHGGFKDRNTKVAEEADVFIAMTFGNGQNVKDGGTADTVGKMQARGTEGYHLDLNTLKLYKIKQ